MKRLVILLVVLAAAGTARADWAVLLGKSAPRLDVSEWANPGDATTLDEFRGRAVLVVHFSPKSTEILGALPRLTELLSFYGKKDLVVLGVTFDADTDLAAWATEQRVPFPLGVAGEGESGWGSGEGVRGCLVGTDGKVVWEGNPSDVPDPSIQKQVKRAKPFYLGKVDAAAKAAGAAFRKGKLFEAENLALAAEGEGSEVVVARVGSIRDYLVRDADAAIAAGDYVRGLQRLNRLSSAFRGGPAGDEAAARMKKVAAEPAAKKDVASHKAWTRLYTEYVRAAGKAKKLKPLVKKVDGFLKKHAGTRCAAFAVAMKEGILGDPAVTAVRVFIARQKIDKSGSTWKTKLPKPPLLEFTPSRSYYWELTTNKGPIRIRLMPAVAPMHVSSTIYLTELGFYDGTVFHRVIPGFMAQGGCPNGNGGGDPGYKYQGEFSPNVKHDRPGLLSMANAGPGTDASQFFITFVPTAHLDGKHTIFGEVVKGMDTVKKLEEQGTAGAGKPKERLELVKARIVVE